MKKDININFGCFASGLPGWINVDNARRHIIISKIPGLYKILYYLGLLTESVYKLHKEDKFKNVIYGDVTQKLKFKNNSVDNIFTSHMLEHLLPNDAIRFLKECKRVLKKNGRIRILIPDLEYEVRTYIENLGNPESSEKFSETLYAAKTKRGIVNGHRWMYDKYSLTNLLMKIGFTNSKLGKFKEGDFPDIEKLDSRQNSLIVEAIK